jgi:putative DNA primase/helicase
MLEGCMTWQRDGLRPPDAVRATTEAYWTAEDVLGQWFEDSCELGSEFEATRSELFESWRDWCGARGRKAGEEADLKQYLDTRAEEWGLRDQRIGPRSARKRGYKGVRVLLDLEGV